MTIIDHIHGSRGSRNWIFQANPDRYRIETSLSVEKEELWNLMQHRTEISVGDHVFIWISGPNAGIYMEGRVVTNPELMVDSERGKKYWTNGADGHAERPRVTIRYTRSFLERPLFKDFLRQDPILENLTIIRSPRGTNFPITLEERRALAEWITL